MSSFSDKNEMIIDEYEGEKDLENELECLKYLGSHLYTFIKQHIRLNYKKLLISLRSSSNKQ